MNSKNLALRLKLWWFSIYFVAAVIIILFETGVLEKGTVTDSTTQYILQVVGVMTSLLMIPVALRGFRKMMDRMEDRPFEKRLKIYMICSRIRLLAFFLVIEFSVVLNYIISDDIGQYCAVIGVICSLFCYPTRSSLEYDVDWEDSED